MNDLPPGSNWKRSSRKEAEGKGWMGKKKKESQRDKALWCPNLRVGQRNQATNMGMGREGGASGCLISNSRHTRWGTRLGVI